MGKQTLKWLKHSLHLSELYWFVSECGALRLYHLFVTEVTNQLYEVTSTWPLHTVVSLSVFEHVLTFARTSHRIETYLVLVLLCVSVGKADQSWSDINLVCNIWIWDLFTCISILFLREAQCTVSREHAVEPELLFEAVEMPNGPSPVFQFYATLFPLPHTHPFWWPWRHLYFLKMTSNFLGGFWSKAHGTRGPVILDGHLHSSPLCTNHCDIICTFYLLGLFCINVYLMYTCEFELFVLLLVYFVRKQQNYL